jgi:tetratricopeptide (TPR) repeat protein
MKKVFLVPLLLVAFAIPSFSQTPKDSPKSGRGEAYLHFAKARMLADSGKVNDAIAEYKKALEGDPDNPAIFAEMADTYLRAQPPRVREAVAAAQSAIKLDANNIDAHKILASIYTSMVGDSSGRAATEDTVNLAIHEFEEIVRIDPSDRQSFLMLGRLYQVKNDDKKAEEIYKKFLGMEPGSEEGVTALARLHMDANDNKQAVELLESFIKEHPDAATAFEALGQAYANLEQFGKAASSYRSALDLDPDNDDLKRALAQALFFDDKYDDAATLYLELAKDNPTDGMALLRLGQIYREQKRYAQAHVYLQQAVKNFPDSIEIQFNMMQLERDEGLLEDAFDRISDIVKRTERANGRYSESEKQNRRVFLTNMVQISETLGRFDDEVTALTAMKAVTDDKDGRLDRSIVDAYRSAKNTDRAIAYAEQALKENPNSVSLRLVHADMIAEKGRVDEAIKSLRDITKGSPQDLEVLVTMANIYQRAKKNDEATTIAESLVKQFPDDVNAYFQQGAIYERQKKYAEAERAFRKALDLEKDNPAVLNYLGYMLADRGVKLDEAVALIEKAVNQDPINGAYLDSLGWAYFRLNKLDLAEQYLTKALKYSATDPTVNDHVGDLYFKQQRFEEARTAWTKTVQLSSDQEEIAKVKKKLDDLKSKLAKP